MQPGPSNRYSFAIFCVVFYFLPFFAVAQSTPTITATPMTGNVYSCTGTASEDPDIGQFTVSGTDLTADITAVSPTGFEISLAADNGYGNSVTLKQSGGVVNATVYVRLAASAKTGTNTGNVTLTSGSTSITAAVNGDGALLPTIDPIQSQTVTNGHATTAIKFTGTATSFNWTNDNPSIGLAASGTGNIASFRAINKGTTPVTATITVTAPPNPGYAYIANEITNNVSIINTSTLQLVPNNISITDPDGVAVSPDGQRVYIASDGAGSLSYINTANNEKINEIATGLRSTGVAVAPDNRTVYVSNYASGTISVIDPTSTHTITIPLAPYGKHPQGIALTPDGSLLYVCCGLDSSLIVINTTSYQIVSHTHYNDILSSSDDVAAAPDGKTMYTDGGYFHAINISDNTYTSTDLEPMGGFGICISPDGTTAYMTFDRGDLVLGDVLVYNIPTNKIVTTITVGYGPYGISITPDGHYVYVCNFNSNTVNIINTVTNTVIATVPVGTMPYSMGNFIKSGSNCNSLPVSFTITVNPGSGDGGDTGGPPPPPPVTIPNTFTPNGDGINDVWNINNIQKFPNCTVNIYNRYGEKMYSSIGYSIPWDGTYKGSALPVGTYYYLIDLKNGYPLLSGYVAIIK
jgi:gliding motility-associated-like protein